jgi:hypothetical protein
LEGIATAKRDPRILNLHRNNHMSTINGTVKRLVRDKVLGLSRPPTHEYFFHQSGLRRWRFSISCVKAGRYVSDRSGSQGTARRKRSTRLTRFNRRHVEAGRLCRPVSFLDQTHARVNVSPLGHT